MCVCKGKGKGKGKAILVQALRGPENFSPSPSVCSNLYSPSLSVCSNLYSPSLSLCSNLYSPSLSVCSNLYSPSLSVRSNLYSPFLSLCSNLYSPSLSVCSTCTPLPLLIQLDSIQSILFTCWSQQTEGLLQEQHKLRTVTQVTLTDSTLKSSKDEGTNTIPTASMLN